MKHSFTTAALLAGMAALAASCSDMKQIKRMPYPETERGGVVDNYFGTEVPDPYRWLEDDNSEATAAWVAAENAVTENYLSQIPFRGAIRERLTELWNYPKEGAPVKHGDWWYYYYNDGLQNQSVLYRTQQPGTPGEVFLDPNTLSEDGTVALAAASFSKDGRYFAYAAAASGSDWVEIRVKDTATGELTTDKISWVKNSGAEWAPDSKGFYYSGYEAPDGSVYSSQNQYQKVYYHALGTPQSVDASSTRTASTRCATSGPGPRRTASGSSSLRRRVPPARRCSTAGAPKSSSARCSRASMPTTPPLR